jgi:hypothetical protein
VAQDHLETIIFFLQLLPKYLVLFNWVRNTQIMIWNILI